MFASLFVTLVLYSRLFVLLLSMLFVVFRRWVIDLLWAACSLFGVRPILFFILYLFAMDYLLSSSLAAFA